MNTQTHTGLHSLRCKYATIRTIHMGGNVRGKYPRGKCPGGNVGGKCPGGNVRGKCPDIQLIITHSLSHNAPNDLPNNALSSTYNCKCSCDTFDIVIQ